MVILWLLACTAGPPAPAGDTDRPPPGYDPARACSEVANLEVVPLDHWGRDLDGVVRFDRAPHLLDDPDAGPGVVLVPLGSEPVDLAVVAEAVEHHPAGVLVAWDGEEATLQTDDRVVTAHDKRDLDGVSCPVITVFLGLDHHWFAGSGAPPSANAFELHVNGEEHWEAVHDEVAAATDRVFWTSWWWDSSFELVRPPGHATLDAAEREAHTTMALLEGLPGVERRVLINRFWGENSDFSQYVNTDAALRSWAEGGGDGFEVMLQGNPTAVPVFGQYDEPVRPWSFGERVLANPRYADRDLVLDDRRGAPREVTFDAASWHQKAVVVDGRVALITGMNTKADDWDGVAHRVFDERRMALSASTDDRLEVRDREALPDFGPRRDYGVRIEGPAVRDVEAMLRERWEEGRTSGALYGDRATAFHLDPPPPEGGVPLQVLVTMPEPWGERSILEAHLKAIGRAEELIFVEDQFFRSPLLQDAVVARMLEEPDLRLVVVTLPVSEIDGGAKWTWLADSTLRSLFPDRYLMLQLRTVDLVVDEGVLWDTVTFFDEPIFTHSKLRIVDEAWLSVGSANANNRSYLYEGELDVAVHDPATVRAVRSRVLSALVGPAWAASLDGSGDDFDVLRMAAEDNQAVADWWHTWADDLDADEAESHRQTTWPSGFVYPLQAPQDWLLDVGPDVF